MKTKESNLNDLTAEQIGKLFPIRIAPYNPDWITLFEQEKALITSTLSLESPFCIEHIGSTSVVGLASKPTIDILIEFPKLNDDLKQTLVKKLELIGYGNMHNATGENKMTFGKGYDENYAYNQTYHVHIRKKGHASQNEIYFRDYLRQNPNARDEYAKLKYVLAEKHQFNREDYTQAKTGFIERITQLQKGKEMEKPLVDKTYLLQKFPCKDGWVYTIIPEIPQDKHK